MSARSTAPQRLGIFSKRWKPCPDQFSPKLSHNAVAVAFPAAAESVSATGIAGLDHILRGGLPAHRLYLLPGEPGSGKTTLALQYRLTSLEAGAPSGTLGNSVARVEVRQRPADIQRRIPRAPSLASPGIASGSIDPQHVRLMSALQPIIIVDDSHDDLFILKRLLARTGAKNALITFDHGDEAKRFLEAAIRTPETNLIPAAIFSDKRMPGLGGLDLLKWLREQPALRTLPFYLLTTAVEPVDAERAKKLGATAFFEKFPPQHLIDELFVSQRKG